MGTCKLHSVVVADKCGSPFLSFSLRYRRGSVVVGRQAGFPFKGSSSSSVCECAQARIFAAALVVARAGVASFGLAHFQNGQQSFQLGHARG